MSLSSITYDSEDCEMVDIQMISAVAAAMSVVFARAQAGVLYPYLGNVRGHRYENTYYPNCTEKLIHRHGYPIIAYKITSDKRCPKCNHPIPITGSYRRKTGGI